MKDILFLIVILLANTIQGVTGFAGTILAIPFSIRLVGYDTAVPVLNVLGILAGVYVLVFNFKYVNWKELGKIVCVMSISIVVGIYIRNYLLNYEKLLYMILGAIVLFTALQGLYKMAKDEGVFARRRTSAHGKEAENGGTPQVENVLSDKMSDKTPDSGRSTGKRLISISVLILSGIVHGMFVCGGPLLISYLTKKIKDSNSFRATISTIWILMNGLIFVTHVYQGMWTPAVVKTQLMSIPFLIGGMEFGSILYKKMSQKVFLLLTYVLLVIAAVTLFLK